MHKEYKEYKDILLKRLTEKRYYHSLCVADEAYRLAQKYGSDSEKAYLCGLLHDITKNASIDEHFSIFTEYNVSLNNIERNSEKLWHAISGAFYVKYKLNIEDQDIFDAIRFHTTAKSNMPLLSKILYLADFTSADRNYDDIDVIRSLVNDSLDKAYKYALSYTVRDLASRDLAIHLDTIAAYNETMLKEINYGK